MRPGGWAKLLGWRYSIRRALDFIKVQYLKKTHASHTPLSCLLNLMVVNGRLSALVHTHTHTLVHKMIKWFFLAFTGVFSPSTELIIIPTEQFPCKLLGCLNKQQVCSLGNHYYLGNASHHDNKCLFKSFFCSLFISVDLNHSVTRPCPSTRATGIILTAADTLLQPQYGLV